MLNLSLQKNFDAGIIGAGAAGLFCGRLLALSGIKTIIFESGIKPGRKLAISGGGRANFSNRFLSAKNYLAEPPDFPVYALDYFKTSSILHLLKKWHLLYEERQKGRYFLKEEAQKLVEAIKRDYEKAGGLIVYDCPANKITAAQNKFEIYCKKGRFVCQRLVLACGSIARPNISGPKTAWNIPADLGHTVIMASPALTPLHYTDNIFKKKFASLSGVSVRVKICPDKEHIFDDMLLFCHNGISGPAVLSASLFIKKEADIAVNFLPDANFENMLDLYDARSGTPRSILKKYIPQRLADQILPEDIANIKNSQISRKNRSLLAKMVNNFIFHRLKPGNIHNAEVCSGGVNLAEINSKTMESLLVPNLFFAGEMMNVTGELGGYNIHWAFASANCAAKAIIS